MKKGLVFFCLCLGFTSAFAQSHAFRFFTIPDTAVMYQTVLGRVGSKIFLINQRNPENLDLYGYDTLSRTGRQYVHRFPRMMLNTLSRPHSFGFVGIYQQGDKLRYRYLELGPGGDSLQGHSDTLALLNSRFNILPSSDERHLLYYQCRRFSDDSAWIQGTMIGANGRIEKVLYYTFKHDKERDQEPSVFLDNSGNTHILVYDKFDNYRLSTNVSINTIFFANEFMTSESFDLRKVKLRTMDLFQDAATGRINAKGLYGEAQSYMIRGMYNLSFPVERRREMRPRYSVFTRDMIRTISKNFNNQTTEQTLNQLTTEYMAPTGDGVTAVFHLDPLGAPSGTASYYVNPNGQRQAYVDQVNKFAPVPLNLNSLTDLERKNGDIAPPVLLGPTAKPLPHYTPADSWNGPKLVFLRTNASHEIEWCAAKGQYIFSSPDPSYNHTLYASDAQEAITLLYENNDVTKADVPRPVLVSFRNGQRVTEKVADKYVLFSPVQPMRDRLFGAIFYNPLTYESGIMVIQPAENQL